MNEEILTQVEQYYEEQGDLRYFNFNTIGENIIITGYEQYIDTNGIAQARVAYVNSYLEHEVNMIDENGNEYVTTVMERSLTIYTYLYESAGLIDYTVTFNGDFDITQANVNETQIINDNSNLSLPV